MNKFENILRILVSYWEYMNIDYNKVSEVCILKTIKYEIYLTDYLVSRIRIIKI